MLRSWGIFAMLGATVASGALVVRPVTFWGPPPLAQAPPVWDYDMNASGYPIERSACLTIRVGDEAAAECGDLRVTHELPAVRIYNSRLAPTLVYNSEHAHPRVSTPLLITLASTTTRPDSVEVEVSAGAGLDPKTVRATRRWAGSEWGASGTVTRRVTVAYDALADTTGIYLLQFRVTNIYPGNVRVQSPDIAGGSRIVVNRSTSPFGAGWWLAGHEQVKKTLNNGEQQYLWIGGDGSARQFGFSYTIGYDRIDSLRYDPATQIFTRRLPEGRRVEFDALGQHLRTVNRFGRVTQYTYGSFNKVASIALPAPTGLSYNFTYTSGRISSITAPPIGATSRLVTLTNATGVLTDIQNPGDVAVHYDYHAGPANVLYRRVNRRGVPTTFVFDSALKVRSSTVDPGAGASAIVWTIKAGESRGLANSEVAPTASSVDTAQSATRIDGPRTDVADTTLIFQGRFGGARRIVDALGAQTIIRPRYLEAQSLSEPDNGWLVWRVDLPAGTVAAPATRIQRFRYEIPRGNLVVVKDSSASGSPAADSTLYQWDQSFDQLKKVVPMLRDSTEFGIHATNGRREWQQDARGTSARITFVYSDANYPEQVTSVVYPATATLPAATYTFSYQGPLRNSYQETSPRLLVTTSYTDQIGRVYQVDSPVDTSTTSARLVRRTLGYSVRDDLLSETNEAIGFGAVEKTTVVRTFNAEQQLERLARGFFPDPAGIDSIKTQWRYDLAGRQVAEVAPDLRVDSTVYDAASNAITVVTRRYVASPPGGMPPVTTTYDALNRPQRRTIPAYSYPGVKKGIANLPSASTFNLDSTYGPYAIPAVVDTFTYTRDGLIQSANNRWASIARVYSVRGELQQETLDVMREDGTLGSPVSHHYVTKYAYDRNGRRIRLVLPPQFGPAGQDSIKYAYSAWGALEHVIDPSGTDFTYTYDARGAVVSTIFGTSGVSQFLTYDQDGRLRKDSVSNASSTWPRWPRTHLRRSFFTLDGRDLQLAQHDSAWYGERTLSSYSGLGYLKDAYHAENGKTFGNIPGFTGTYYHVDRDTLTLDGLGNRRRAKNMWETGVNGPGTPVIADYTSSYLPGVGRLAAMTATLQGTRTFAYDSAGNEVFSSLDGSVTNCQAAEDRASFYDGLNRLVAEQRRWVINVCNLSNAFERSFEEYRYDALGRRVWVHGKRECDFVPAGYPEPAGDLALQCKLTFMRRTVWDGAQELVEIQAPGAPASVAMREQDVGYQAALPLDFRSPLPKDPNRYYGQVVYTTGLAVDQPLSVRRLSYADRPIATSYTQWPSFTVVPLWDRQGTAKLGVFSDGAWAKPLTGGGTACQPGASAQRCVQLVWAEASSVYDLLRGWAPQSYMGSLLEQKRNASGTYYRRARVYDPAAGRFTQEDPIGLAGGLNLYGFANGDPVNFSDPFGLYACDPPASCRAQLIAFGTTLGTGAGVLVAGGCIAGSGGICVLGAPGIVGGLAAAGAASGAVAGQVAEQADAIALEMGKIGNKIRSIVTGILIGRGGGLSDEQELIRKGGAKPATEQVEEERRRKELEKKRGEGAPGPKDPLDQP